MSDDAKPVDDGSGGVGRASLVLASGTVVSRILGFVKIIVLANVIGQVGSASADAFGVANRLPDNIFALIAGGVLAAVLVPQIVRASMAEDRGQAYVNKLITIGIIVFAVATAIATLAAPVLVRIYAQSAEDGGRGFSEATMELATAFAWWCLPQIFFFALYSLLSQVLNARGIFGPYTWAPVLNNIVAIAGLSVLAAMMQGIDARDADAWTAELIGVLGATATLGVAAQALILTFFWRRTGLKFRFDFRWRGVGLRSTGRAAGWVFGMVLLTQLSAIVHTRVGSLGREFASIATLQNSWLVFMLPHSVVAVSIATAYFTRMSGHAGRGDIAALRSDLSDALRSIGLVLVFAAVAFSVVAYPLASVFEQRFDDASAMANVLIAFLIGLPPLSAVFVMQRVYYALDETRTTFFGQVVYAVLFVTGALLVAATTPAPWIAVGIALVTSIASYLQLIWFVWLLRRRLGGVDGRRIGSSHVRYALLSLVAGAMGFAVAAGFGGFEASGFAHEGIPQALLAVSVSGLLMCVVYAVLLVVFRDPSFRVVVDAVAARLRRR